MQIDLTPQQEEMIRRKIASGLYVSASELIHEALHRLMDEDRIGAARLWELQADIEEGLASGPATPWSSAEAKSEGRRRRDAGASDSNPNA